MGNPYFDIVKRDIPALFDSIVFNLTSFDYLSHIICYICQTNKQDSVYWTRLANSGRGQNNYICYAISSLHNGVKGILMISFDAFTKGLSIHLCSKLL